ncbi:MAG: V-type ATP synthase subunit D [bacterium]
MTQVSKGALRANRLKVARLNKAVPTLDLRRKQLTREMMSWDERMRRMRIERDELAAKMEANPHPEIEKLVSIVSVEIVDINIAGVILKELKSVKFVVAPYSLIMTPPSFDYFAMLRSKHLESLERLRIMEESFERLSDELAVTTQRINLFEKRLIPQCEEGIRYIRGRLEDNERSTVMVAKIAQASLLGKQESFESA